MKRNLIAAILLTAAVAFSCTTKEEKSASLINDGSIVYHPTASIKGFVLDGPDTKTVLSIDAITGAKFTFAEGDALGVYPYDPELGTQVGFTVTSVDAESCTFNGGGFGLKSGQLYAVYYPYSEAGNVDDPTEENINNVIQALPVDYTQQRQAAADDFDISEADYLVDNGVTPSNNTCEFEMSHVGALLVMDVTFAEAGSYTELTLTSKGTPFITTGTLNLTASEIAVKAEGTADSVTLALGEENGEGLAVAAGATVRFCMMVAPVNLKSSTVTITLKDSENVEHKGSFKNGNFKAGFAYRLTASVSSEAAAEPTNLSANGTANSYIVSTAGDYYFDATVAGNGQTVNFASKNFVNANCWPFIDGAYTSALPAGGNVRVVLNQNNCVKDVYYADGFIHFTATGAEGNAKLLMMDAVNDDPAWVWHIWCTDAPSIITLTDASSWGFTYQIMDRNLGAIKATFEDPTNPNNNLEEVCGLYYEYGNPTGWTWAEYSAASVNSKGWRMVDGIAGAAKYGKPYIDISNDYYWFNPYSGSANQLYGLLWGGGSAGDASLNRGPAAVKTMYDPCPVGYKVVPIDFSISASDSGDQYGWFKNGTDGSVYFPYNGCAWEGGNFWMGRGYVPDGDTAHYTALWTSGHNNRNMAYFYNCYSKDVNRAGGGTVSDHIIARGMGVRCVAE